MKLNSILLSLIPQKSYELIEEALIVLKNYAKMLDRSEFLNDDVKNFVEKLLTDLKEPDPIVRRNILEVCFCLLVFQLHLFKNKIELNFHFALFFNVYHIIGVDSTKILFEKYFPCSELVLIFETDNQKQKDSSKKKITIF